MKFSSFQSPELMISMLMYSYVTAGAEIFTLENCYSPSVLPRNRGLEYIIFTVRLISLSEGRRYKYDSKIH